MAVWFTSSLMISRCPTWSCRLDLRRLNWSRRPCSWLDSTSSFFIACFIFNCVKLIGIWVFLGFFWFFKKIYANLNAIVCVMCDFLIWNCWQWHAGDVVVPDGKVTWVRSDKIVAKNLRESFKESVSIWEEFQSNPEELRPVPRSNQHKNPPPTQKNPSKNLSNIWIINESIHHSWQHNYSIMNELQRFDVLVIDINRR